MGIRNIDFLPISFWMKAIHLQLEDSFNCTVRFRFRFPLESLSNTRRWDESPPPPASTVTQLQSPLLWETLVFNYCLLIMAPRLRHYSWQASIKCRSTTEPDQPTHPCIHSASHPAQRLRPAVVCVGPQPLDRNGNQREGSQRCPACQSTSWARKPRHPVEHNDRLCVWTQ